MIRTQKIRTQKSRSSETLVQITPAGFFLARGARTTTREQRTETVIERLCIFPLAGVFVLARDALYFPKMTEINEVAFCF
jgi:hypothetical protein